MTGLKRHIGWIALTLYGLGDILGSGVYGLTGKAAGEMGNAAWIAFVASMITAGLTGLSYASIGSRYPKAAGAAYVSFKAFGIPFVSYAIGLMALASGLTSMATATRVFSGYWTGMMPFIPMNVAILAFITLVTAVVYKGIKEAMWVNILCTLVEVSGLLFIIFVSFPYWGSVDYLDASSVENPLRTITPSLILGGAVLTFYSFVGFEDILNVSEEVIDPQRNVPKGLLLAVVLSTIIYISVMVGAVSVLPAHVLSASKQPLVDVAAKAAPWMPSKIFALVAMFAVANTALLNFIMGSRLLYGMSKHKLLPSFLSKVNKKLKTPTNATFFVCGILLILVFSGDISSLAKATSVLLLSCFFVVNIALLILQRRKNEPKAHFEVPSIVPILGALSCLLILSYAKKPELLIALIVLAAITIFYFISRPSRHEIESALLEDN